jgi:hypothetical protein
MKRILTGLRALLPSSADFALAGACLYVGLTKYLLAQVTHSAEIGRPGYQAQNVNDSLRRKFQAVTDLEFIYSP